MVNQKTLDYHEWMKNLDDDTKMKFAINWKIPHTLFNVACGIHPDTDGSGYNAALQDIDWYYIYQSRDLGNWSHGGPVYVQSFGE